MRYLIALATFVAFTLAACDDTPDDPGATPPPGATATRPAASPAPSGTQAPPVDGTIDPLGAGGIEPVIIKGTTDPPTQVSVLRAVRMGAHPEQGGWDRIVFEFQDSSPPGEIAYLATTPATGCGSGLPIPVPGEAVLEVRFTVAQAHTDAGQPTLSATTLTGPGRAILQARQTCDFEAHVNWAIGVRAKQRFKVTRLTNPPRVVIDIKW